MPNAPTESHRRALHRVLAYLACTRKLVITYRLKAGWDSWIYKDAAHGTELHRGAQGVALSRSGYAFWLAGAIVDKASLRQGHTSLSTAEAEWGALCLACRRGLAVRRVIEFATRRTLPPTIIYEDNQSVIRHNRDIMLN